GGPHGRHGGLWRGASTRSRGNSEIHGAADHRHAAIHHLGAAQASRARQVRKHDHGSTKALARASIPLRSKAMTNSDERTPLTCLYHWERTRPDAVHFTQ